MKYSSLARRSRPTRTGWGCRHLRPRWITPMGATQSKPYLYFLLSHHFPPSIPFLHLRTPSLGCLRRRGRGTSHARKRVTEKPEEATDTTWEEELARCRYVTIDHVSKLGSPPPRLVTARRPPIPTPSSHRSKCREARASASTSTTRTPACLTCDRDHFR
jgi:hypothetical protein